jgi:hypothetical protein
MERDAKETFHGQLYGIDLIMFPDDLKEKSFNQDNQSAGPDSNPGSLVYQTSSSIHYGTNKEQRFNYFESY